MILKKLKRQTGCVLLAVLLPAQTSIGNDEIKILETGDCVKETTVAMPHKTLENFMNCCEQRDRLAVEINEDRTPGGIISNSPYMDIAIAFGSGVALTLIYEEVNRNRR